MFRSANDQCKAAGHGGSRRPPWSAAFPRFMLDFFNDASCLGAEVAHSRRRQVRNSLVCQLKAREILGIHSRIWNVAAGGLM
jgi:hypothetical protein